MQAMLALWQAQALPWLYDATRLELDAIQISAGGSFEFWFNDGDLFWGHAIHVTGSLDKGPERAQMEG